jgi:FAD synthase
MATKTYSKIVGSVIRGDGYGRKLGFPTVNLEMNTEALPPEGVYAGTAILDEVEYRAGIIIGPKEKVEAHLIGYDGDAYGKIVSLELNKFLRAYKNFDTEQELIIQIKKDITKC